VGDIPLELQPKIAARLAGPGFERLGSTRTIKVDIRLIAATNRDLAHAVAEKEFRSDLLLSAQRLSHPDACAQRTQVGTSLLWCDISFRSFSGA